MNQLWIVLATEGSTASAEVARAVAEMAPGTRALIDLTPASTSSLTSQVKHDHGVHQGWLKGEGEAASKYEIFIRTGTSPSSDLSTVLDHGVVIVHVGHQATPQWIACRLPARILVVSSDERQDLSVASEVAMTASASATLVIEGKQRVAGGIPSIHFNPRRAHIPHKKVLKLITERGQ